MRRLRYLRLLPAAPPAAREPDQGPRRHAAQPLDTFRDIDRDAERAEGDSTECSPRGCTVVGVGGRAGRLDAAGYCPCRYGELRRPAPLRTGSEGTRVRRAPVRAMRELSLVRRLQPASSGALDPGIAGARGEQRIDALHGLECQRRDRCRRLALCFATRSLGQIGHGEERAAGMRSAMLLGRAVASARRRR